MISMKIKFGLSSNTLLILCVIFLLGFLLRVVNISSFPNGFSRDEAYLGYNAYSILNTGRDINGHFLPLFIESFLYTPAGYAYISIPFIKIFGLSVFSVRIASAIFGALTIPAIFFLTKSLLTLDKGKKYSGKTIAAISLLSALFLAVTPWHINLSRTASVTSVVAFFIVLGCYFFARWILYQEKKFIVISFIFYFFSLFFYIAPFSFLPPFVLFLFILFKNTISTTNKNIFGLLYILFLIPIFVVFLSPTLSLRMQSLSITKNPLVSLVLSEDTGRDGAGNIPPLVARAFHNKVTVVADLFAQNYFTHFSYNFLFRDIGFPERFKIPGSGLLLPITLIFIVLGIYYLIRDNGSLRWLLIGWILLGPIGSGFASDDVPNLQRTLFMLPPLLILSAIGLVNLFAQIHKRRKIKIILGLSFFIIFAYEAIFYMHQYYFHENAYRPWYRQEGYAQLVDKVNKYKRNFSKIVITDRESAPTIFFLFFNRYNPYLLQKKIEKSVLRDTDRIGFSNYEMSQEECPLRVIVDGISGAKTLMGKKGILYVNSGLCKNENLPSSVKILDTIFRSDGSKVFSLVSID